MIRYSQSHRSQSVPRPQLNKKNDIRQVPLRFENLLEGILNSMWLGWLVATLQDLIAPVLAMRTLMAAAMALSSGGGAKSALFSAFSMVGKMRDSSFIVVDSRALTPGTAILRNNQYHKAVISMFHETNIEKYWSFNNQP